MYRTILFPFALLTVAITFGYSTFYTQTPTPNPPAIRPIKQVDYSESIPYQPRVFPTVKDSKNKWPKDNRSGLSQTAVKTLASQELPFKFPVSVFTSDDKAVDGLSKPDLKVFIGDEEQEILSIETDKPLNVVLLVDVSPSTESRMNEIRDIATHLVENLKPGDKIMVAEFAANMKVIVDFTTDRKAIAKAISKLKMDNGTAIYNAVSELFQKNLRLLKGPSLIVLLSDGIDTVSRKSDYLSSLVDAEKGNAVIIPVYFDTLAEQLKNAKKTPKSIIPFFGNQQGQIMEEREMGIIYFNDLINLSGGRGISNEPSHPDIAFLPMKISSWLRGQYFVTIKPSITVKSDRRLPFRVRVNRPNLIVLAKGSYFNGN